MPAPPLTRSDNARHADPTGSPVVVAIDAGTTGVRALVVDATGAIIDRAYHEITQHFPQPAWVEHDADEIWAAVCLTVNEVVGRLASGPPAAFGITNQRETVVAWDRRTGRPLHRAIVWQDRRTAAHCDRLRQAGHLPTVRRRTGLVLDPYFSATKMAWLLNEGGLASHADDAEDPTLVLATVDTWILWNLTGGPDGGVLATDPTNASRTLLYDITERQWSDELCDLFGVPAHVLAAVRPSCGRFGTVAVAALDALDTPLTPTPSPTLDPSLDNVPISGIAGDQQAALFGQACFQPGEAKATFGTGTFLLANAGHQTPPVPEGIVATIAWDLGQHAPDHANPVTYALEGSAFSSGAAIQWLRDGLGLIDHAEQMGPLAASVPDSGGIAFVPAFTGLGSPWWDPRARGTVTGITRGAGRAQLARAVVEALAYEVRGMIEVMVAASSQSVSVLRADGGAAAMELLLQLLADQIQAPVARPRSVESTALGAATLAGLAEGVWSSLDELAALWELDVEFTPQVDQTWADLLYNAWLPAVDRARDWAADGDRSAD